MITKVDVMGLLNTDPLAQFALGGLAVTLLVTLGIFAFVLTRRSKRSKTQQQ